MSENVFTCTSIRIHQMVKTQVKVSFKEDGKLANSKEDFGRQNTSQVLLPWCSASPIPEHELHLNFYQHYKPLSRVYRFKGKINLI